MTITLKEYYNNICSRLIFNTKFEKKSDIYRVKYICTCTKKFIPIKKQFCVKSRNKWNVTKHIYIMYIEYLISLNNEASPFPQERERTWVEHTCMCGQCTVSCNQTPLLSSWTLEKKTIDFGCNVHALCILIGWISLITPYKKFCLQNR